MCGLLAGSGELKAGILTALGCLNVTRGHDSAGIAWVNGEKVSLEKVAQHPVPAFTITLKSGLISASKSHAMIGHTRAATQGKVIAKNAHPFIMEEIGFAHNGVIQNDEDFGKYEVDSQCLIHGIKARDFSKYVGSIALVWLESGKLHAYRKGNPLYMGRLSGGVYLASERNMLERVGCKNVRELNEGRIYTFDGAKVESKLPVPENSVYGARVTLDIERVIDSKFDDDDGSEPVLPVMQDLQGLNEDYPV